MANIVSVLYDDPKDGHPVTYARDGIPSIEIYADGQTTPSPAAIDYRPGELLGDTTGALGLGDFIAAHGHTLTVVSDHDGPDSRFDLALPEADIVILQACWPALLTQQRIALAGKLRLVIVAGDGADDIDLDAAATRGITVAEITHSTSTSTAEYALLLILSLVHNAGPAVAASSGPTRSIADYAHRAYDLEAMQVGIVGAGRVGLAVLRRLRPFDVRLHYTDPRRLPLAVEDDLRLTYHPNAAAMAPICDVVSLHSPLRKATANLFDTTMIAEMKRGAYLVNTAHTGLCDPGAVAHALETGRLAGYAADSPIRSGTPTHIAGLSLSAQARYAAGVREVLECWFDDVPIRGDYLTLDRGRPTSRAERSYGIRRYRE